MGSDRFENMKTIINKKIQLFLTKVRGYWVFFLVALCILVGGILIKPILGLVPVLLDMAWVKPERSDPVLRQIHGDTPAITPKDQPHDYFLPLIALNDPQIESDHPISKNEDLLASIDFSPHGASISMIIEPNHSMIELDERVEISFLPGDRCTYGDGRACVYTFYLSDQNKVTFASVHSGMGGEGEPFRDMIEGTGLNQGLFTANQVSNNTQSISGSKVSIQQGNSTITGLTLTTIARIPPAHLETYLSLPVEQTLAFVMELGLLDSENLNGDVFVLETCGWQLPGEENNVNYPNTTQSIYLGIIH